jgi:hypothetical protein
MASRCPRPAAARVDHLTVEPIFLVGRERMQHPTSGRSQPSVGLQLVTFSISPDPAVPVRHRAGFGVDPSMCSAHAGFDELVAQMDGVRR